MMDHQGQPLREQPRIRNPSCSAPSEAVVLRDMGAALWQWTAVPILQMIEGPSQCVPGPKKGVPLRGSEGGRARQGQGSRASITGRRNDARDRGGDLRRPVPHILGRPLGNPSDPKSGRDRHTRRPAPDQNARSQKSPGQERQRQEYDAPGRRGLSRGDPNPRTAAAVVTGARLVPGPGRRHRQKHRSLQCSFRRV